MARRAESCDYVPLSDDRECLAKGERLGRLVEPGLARYNLSLKGMGERGRTGPALIREVAANKVGEANKLCSGAV